ncbi:MAG TPA: SUMF1/EgtB/PvdO family nonheme iron enzyme, partial [Phycisphaerales bacterium]|nr:SUMF1/EgtB/PvdO family nonheme iron enzyme [Phycisphaerales bacterium]
ALGAALFETLTGELPHPIDHLPLTHALRRITDTPPRELAALRPDLRGDLDVILATALQSDRDRRYQSAQALAEDLEAFLAFRPIRARPPSRLRLARMWTARHPALATALGLVLITALAFLTFIAVQRHSARLKHERDISAALAQATQLVQSYTDQVSQTRLRQNELADVENWLYRYNAPDRALELERREQQLLRAQSQHEAAFHQALDFLASAERLGVDEPSAKLLYAKLYLARLREAEASGDRFARNLYQNLVHENDPGNLLAGELIDQFPITIHTDPPNTQVHLFRLVEQSELLPDGEPRLIPIPFNDPNPAKTADLTRNFALTILDGKHLVDPNAIVLAVNSFPIRNSLLVTSAPGPIRPLDRLVSIDNQPIRELYDLSHLSSATSQPTTHTYKFAHPGIPDPITLTGPSLESLNITIADPASAIQGLGGVITIYHDGQTSDLVIPPTLRFCITSKPLLLSNASLLGTAPIENHPLDRGTYIALLLADNYEPLRIPIITRESDARSNAAAPPWNLLPLGSTPENFVRLPDSLSMMMRPLWIMRREVTVAEYLEFLNDPETLAAIKNASTPMLVPRTTGIPEFGRNPDGTYNPGEELQPNWPVPCVNWHDAKAYADWMTRRARAAGRDVHFDLPSHQEWLSAWGSSSDNQFPWGDHFRPWWASSNFARATPQIEPVMSFPIDESNLGVFDLAGSLSEWLDAWWMQSRDLREFAGGSWGNGGFNYREMFMLYGQNGITSKATSGTLGFRLVMRLGPPSPPADTN